MEFRVLGSLEVLIDGEMIEVGHGLARRLLAMLVLEANRQIAVDRLIDQLWGEELPANPRNALQLHVAKLRRLLEPGREARSSGQVIRRQGDGYVLTAGVDEVDLVRFDHLVAEGRRHFASGRFDAARACFADGLGLWRGPLLADMRREPFVVGSAARADAERLSVFEDLFDVELELGRHAEITPELERVVQEAPLRERLRAQQMLALYRGRL